MMFGLTMTLKSPPRDVFLLLAGFFLFAKPDDSIALDQSSSHPKIIEQCNRNTSLGGVWNIFNRISHA